MQTRVCNVCKVELVLDQFHNAKRLPLGKCYTCKSCARLRTTSWAKSNPERKKDSSKAHYESNKESYIERAKKLQWQKNNREKARFYSKLRWKTDGGRGVARLAKRRSIKKNACPPWLSDSQKTEIQNFYWLAKDLKAITGEDYHVDHIIPLQNPEICGLHVPWNLQILPSDLNLSKNNRFNPDQVVFGY